MLVPPAAAVPIAAAEQCSITAVHVPIRIGIAFPRKLEFPLHILDLNYPFSLSSAFLPSFFKLLQSPTPQLYKPCSLPLGLAEYAAAFMDSMLPAPFMLYSCTHTHRQFRPKAGRSSPVAARRDSRFAGSISQAHKANALSQNGNRGQPARVTHPSAYAMYIYVNVWPST